MVWPWKAEILPAAPAVPEPGVAYLTIDGAPEGGRAEILFRNDAGALWRARAAETR